MFDILILAIYLTKYLDGLSRPLWCLRDKLLFNVGVGRHNFVVISQDLCWGSEFGHHVKHDRLVKFDGEFCFSLLL